MIPIPPGRLDTVAWHSPAAGIVAACRPCERVLARAANVRDAENAARAHLDTDDHRIILTAREDRHAA